MAAIWYGVFEKFIVCSLYIIKQDDTCIQQTLSNDNNVMTNLLNMNSSSQLKLWLCHVKLSEDVHRMKIDFI